MNDLARELGPAKTFRTERAQLAHSRWVLTIPWHDEGNDAFAPLTVGDTDYTHVDHCWMLRQYALDRRGAHVDTAGHDHVLDSIEHGQMSVGVDPPEIAGAQPALRCDHLSSRSLVAEVTAHHHSTSHKDLSTCRNGDLHTVERLPVVDTSTAALREPVGGVHLGPSRYGVPEQPPGNRTPTDEDSTKAMQRCTGFEQPRQHRGHDRHERATARRTGDLADVEAGMNSQSRVAKVATSDDRQPRDVVQRYTREPAILFGCELERFAHRACGRFHRLAGEHDVTGLRRGAGGSDDRRDIIGNPLPVT